MKAARHTRRKASGHHERAGRITAGIRKSALQEQIECNRKRK